MSGTEHTIRAHWPQEAKDLARKLSSKCEEQRQLISDLRMTRGMVEWICPVCDKPIEANQTYVNPLRHLLEHLYPGERTLEVYGQRELPPPDAVSRAKRALPTHKQERR